MRPTLTAFALLVALAACSVTTPYEVMAEPFASQTGTLEARGAQIRRALTGLGWTLTEDDPGHILAHKGEVSVLIEYDANGFSLHEINPPADPDEIERWNKEVETLEQNIQAQSKA